MNSKSDTNFTLVELEVRLKILPKWKLDYLRHLGLKYVFNEVKTLKFIKHAHLDKKINR